MKVLFLTIGIILFSFLSPLSGQSGTAIHKDSSIISGWAVHCEVSRGYIKISDTSLTFEDNNKAMHGITENATGKADGNVVSLGDSGIATLTFSKPITNGDGPDFAVFENGFRENPISDKYFLELAFVEVSSNGVDFVRFPALSETPVATQVGTFDNMIPSNIHNLAGKDVLGYGTPFDLNDLKDSSGIDLNHITHVKIVDVVGTIKTQYASYDAYGNIVNDPWPTPFSTGGFDLDGVAVIHFNETNDIGQHKGIKEKIKFYPNPCRDQLYVKSEGEKYTRLEFYDKTGRLVLIHDLNDVNPVVNISQIAKGQYIVRIISSNNVDTSVLIKE